MVRRLLTLTLLLWCGTVSFATAQAIYYNLNDFQWYTQYADGSKRPTELVSQLSRTHILVGILWANATEQERKHQSIQAFLQELPTTSSAIVHVTPGPQNDTFASYILTLDAPRSFASMITFLNTMQSRDTLDFVLPIFALTRGTAAPFIEFTATFASGTSMQAIARFLNQHHVTALSRRGGTYTLRVAPKAPTNILAVLQAFEDTSGLVTEVKPIWLNVATSSTPAPTTTPASTPAVAPAPLPLITAHVTIDTGWNLPLRNVREPMIYRVEIEHDTQVQVLPDSIAPSALRRALVRATNLPTELFDITETENRTTTLPNARVQMVRVYTLRVSKPGTYTLPTLRVSYIPPSAQSTPRTLDSTPVQGYQITVTSHLPANLQALPGDILAPPSMVRPPWAGTRPLALGLGLSGLGVLVIGLLLLKPRERRAQPRKVLSRRRLRRTYELALHDLRQTIPEATGTLSSDARAWLRQCSALFRRFLGEWSYGDVAHFAGAAGISTAMITEHFAADLTPTMQEQLLAPALAHLQELDHLAAAPPYTLTASDYVKFCAAFESMLIALTTNEGRRVVFRSAARV